MQSVPVTTTGSNLNKEKFEISHHASAKWCQQYCTSKNGCPSFAQDYNMDYFYGHSDNYIGYLHKYAKIYTNASGSKIKG